MSRGDRLLDLAELLRGRDETTVGALANELAVSRRTVLRDLATLRARGLPIRGEPGPGGGIRLDGGRGVTAVHLALGEVVALWLAARLSREASQLPWNDAARSGLAKLLASLPAPRCWSRPRSGTCWRGTSTRASRGCFGWTGSHGRDCCPTGGSGRTLP